MFVAWTTVSTPEEAARLARGAVEMRLAACVQVEGPIASYYRWENRLETAPEYRLLFKFLPEQAAGLESWIRQHHPYDTPEWVVLRAEHVAEKYLSWARSTFTSGPFP